MSPKVTGLLWKGAVFGLSFGYIIYRLFLSDAPLELDMFHRALTFPNASVYLGVFLLLMPLNWYLESLKWRTLLRTIDIHVSQATAVRAVLNGLTLGIFTPNRVGEFVGRILPLPAERRPEGIMLSVFNSLSQLLITIGCAGLSVIFFQSLWAGEMEELDEKLLPMGELMVYAGLFLCFSFLLLYFLSLVKIGGSWGQKITQFLAVSRRVGWKASLMAIGFSLLRYVVFLVQYWLVLRWFGIIDPDWTGWILIPLIFFVTSVIPGVLVFPIDVSVRGAAAVFFLTPVCVDEEAILFASILIWAVNIACPALVGGFLLWRKDVQ